MINTQSIPVGNMPQLYRCPYCGALVQCEVCHRNEGCEVEE